MANQDPYSVIKAEIERELQQIGPLQAELFAHPANREGAKRLRQQLDDVQQQLAALEKAVQAMVAAPAQYRLDLRTAYTRQVEVETLRFQLSDLQATSSHIPADVPDAGAAGFGSSSSSSSRPHQSIELHAMAGSSHPSSNGHLSSSSNRSRAAPLKHSKLVQHHGGGGGGKAGSQQQPSSDSRPQPDAGVTSFNTFNDDGLASYESVMQQQVQQQEQDLDHISLHVDRIKQTGQLMHDELEEQSLLLGGLQSDTDTTQLRLRGVRRKVGDVLKQARNDRQLCLILVLSLVLVVLVMLALA